MNNENSKNICEERFFKIRSNMNKSQLKSQTYAIELSRQYENEDIELAYRIMQHAYRIDTKSNEVNKKLTYLRRKMSDTDNELTIENIDEILDKQELEKKDSAILSEPVIGGAILEKLDFLPAYIGKYFFLLVIFPWLIFVLYQLVFASNRYESQSQIVVKQPDNMATLDTSMAILSGLGMSSGGKESQLVQAYIYSNDMLLYVDKNLSLRNHYVNSNNDIFSGLYDWSSNEDFLRYYHEHVLVDVDDVSSVITVTADAFTSEFAQQLNQLIINRAEWFINSVGQNLAKEQLKFVQGEHDLVGKKLEKIKSELLVFQNKHHLLDAEATGIAFQQIAYSLESNISAKKAELYTLRASLSEKAPEIQIVKNTIAALEQQLADENQRISGDLNEETIASILATFSGHKIKLELALQAYASSLISLEKSRMEAYRKLQYLVIVESSTLPDDNKYPEVLYNISLFAVILLLLFGIGQISMATIRELS